ncbi:MAG: sigma-70 family RNA polymerase sigma factor [Deltaproteobacteria bacterium]|nr:sigma-70 family RNA polymerase sigma factor [Deltaproteobacteria bacterium]
MHSDEALYERLLKGDLGAFDLLYARYERHLFGFVRRHLEDTQESEDVFHEAFLALLRERGSGRSAVSFRALLFQIARNLCLNRLRSRGRAARALEVEGRTSADPLPHPESALERREAVQALHLAVARLPEPLAELYGLRAAGMSYEEMSQVLAIPLGTVKSRMHEMVGRLRKETRSWTAS